MIRHGSRTPYAAGIPCWENYDVQVVQLRNVTDSLLPSPALYNYSSQDRPEQWLFRLIYDAFRTSWGQLHDGATCARRLLTGGSQWQALADLYLNNADNSFNLFDTNNFNDIDQGELFTQ